MIRGWYTGASGMNAQQHRLDAIANNLANVDTAAYKRDVTVSKSFSELLSRRTNADGVYKTVFGSADAAPVIGKLGLGVEINENYTDFEQGSFRETSSASDFALSGKGFFVGKGGILETKEGYPVLGENGLIHVEDGEFKVNKDGMITSLADNSVVDRFRVVRFENERYLQKTGSSLYSANDITGEPVIAEGKERPEFMQGFMETSNVNVVQEMVKMIEVNRAYEANQKSIQSEDTMVSTLWSRVAVRRG